MARDPNVGTATVSIMSTTRGFGRIRTYLPSALERGTQTSSNFHLDSHRSVPHTQPIS